MGVLRLVLAAAVVIAHSQAILGVRLMGGLAAVELFFIISGFYMTMILDTKYVGRGSYWLFLSNRALRLYPIYWVVAGLTVAVGVATWAMGGGWGRLGAYVEHWGALGWGTLAYQVGTNVGLVGQDVAMFLGLDPRTGGVFFTSDFQATQPPFHEFLLVPQAWTLGVELSFYLLAPFLVRRSVRAVAGLVGASLGVRGVTYALGLMHDPWTYRFFPSELALFLMGALSYRMYQRLRGTGALERYRVVVVGVFFAVLLGMEFLPGRAGAVRHVMNWGVYGLGCAAIPFLFEWSRSSRLDRRVGELSYPLYVSHVLVISLMEPWVGRLGLEGVRGELALGLSLAAAYLLVVGVSDPVEQVRERRVRRGAVDRTRRQRVEGDAAGAQPAAVATTS